MTALTNPTVANLRGVGLEHVVSTAALQTRVDRKYAVTPEALTSVINSLISHLSVLDVDGVRQFGYRSTYFDTPTFELYRGAAIGRPIRHKVRTRAYLDTGTCWLEVKERQRSGHTMKARIEHPHDAEHDLADEGPSFVGSYPWLAERLDELEPVLATLYERTTLLCTLGQTIGGSDHQRVTIDSALEWRNPDGRSIATMPGWLIVETKSATTHGGPFDRALWRVGSRPLSISKYAAGIALAQPGLPRNRWSRVLNRYFSTSAPTAACAA